MVGRIGQWDMQRHDLGLLEKDLEANELRP